MTLVVMVLATLGRVLLPFRPVQWSRADETVQARMALRASAPRYNYRRAVDEWLADPKAANWPGIVRFLNVYLLAGLFRLTRRNTYHVPQAVSVAFGILTLWLCWHLAGGSLVTALVVAASPLQLHLGRRALQDMGVCALTLTSGALLAAGHPVLAAVSVAALLAYKETSATALPAIGVFGWMSGESLHSVALALTLGPILYWAAWSALTRSPLLLWTVAQRLTQARYDGYGREQEGAPHRLLVDLFILSPVAFLCAARGQWTPALAFGAVLVATQAAFPILRSVRMVTASDALMRVAVVSVAPLWVAVAILLTDLILFWWVFDRRKVYDPITKNLVWALGFAAPDQK